MAWTKQRSTRAVAAKARIRLERMNAELVKSTHKVFVPRPAKPDFKITIEAKDGSRTQITLHRFGKQFLTNDGLRGARSIARGIENLIRFYR